LINSWSAALEIQNVKLEFPADTNIILGQSHFIKTVEDLYEIMVTTVPGARFGVAFSEASGPRLVRAEGNDEQLKQLAIKNVMAPARALLSLDHEGGLSDQRPATYSGVPRSLRNLLCDG